MNIAPKGSIYVRTLEPSIIIDIITAITMDTPYIDITGPGPIESVPAAAIVCTMDTDHTTSTKNILERDLQEEVRDEF
jgi:hypothetical protein